MYGAVITVLFLFAAFYLAYRRLPLLTYTITFSVLLVAYTGLADPSGVWQGTLWVALAVLWLLNVKPLRRALISRPFLRAYLRLLPAMSRTEREALEAGTVWWDGQLFTGKPDWRKFLASPAAKLSAEEQAFIDGPCEQLCRMLDDFDITERRRDLPPEVWEFLKSRGFFAMIIRKEFGGLEFSAYAHSCVLVKIAGRSVTCASTIAVPNSLGPAELLQHYGTPEQQQHFLPRLARGLEIPCFALTGPRVGSDAAALPDTGVVCRGQWQGREVLGLRLNFDKRYITLAPVATVIGLAFRLYDPDHLLGGEVDIGITCALIARDTPGLEIGARHLPLDIPFQNGPLRGRDLFVPIDSIIGGPAMAGQGWRMLIEQLSVGRCISLPGNATGGSTAAVFATGAYARIRRQFNQPVGRFEGVEQVIARMAGLAFIMDAARSVTTAAIDAGERPAVPAAILKYHVTEMARRVANDAMDVQGGKGIILGPRNYLGRGYQSIPIAITVEGANILTRNLMIFGQGAIRCHPYVLREMNAAREVDRHKGVVAFDGALFGHIGFAISNAVRSLVMALTLARFQRVPGNPLTRRYFQHIERFSASFAFAADVAMLSLGGYLKKKESLSARLGDVLSMLYRASTVLKQHEDNGAPVEDLPLVEWACRELLYQAQEQLHGFMRNFPNRTLAAVMRLLIFPRGRTYFAPGDRLGRKVAQLMMDNTASRARLTRLVYREQQPSNPLGLLQQALELAPLAEPIEKQLRVAGVKAGKVTALDLPGQVEQGLALGIIDAQQAETLRRWDQLTMQLINVDEFAPGVLESRGAGSAAGAAAPATH